MDVEHIYQADVIPEDLRYSHVSLSDAHAVVYALLQEEATPRSGVFFTSLPCSR